MKKYVVHSGYRKSKPVTAERIQQRYADGDILNDATVQESGTTFSVPIAVFINDCVMNSRTKAHRQPANGKRQRRKAKQTEAAAPGTSSPATAPSPPPPTAKPSAPPKPRRTKTLTTTKPCPFCFEPIQIEARKCKNCGELLDPTLVRASVQVHQHDEPSRIAAALLAIFLGHFGAHKFYLGQSGRGVVYLLLNVFFFWTVIVPLVFAVICLIEGIVYLTYTDRQFASRYARD
jgi:TM2 domain-containing membrane protein YozV